MSFKGGGAEVSQTGRGKTPRSKVAGTGQVTLAAGEAEKWEKTGEGLKGDTITINKNK